MTASAAWVSDRAEIIWLHHSPCFGTEMSGMHPMLVTALRAFNGHAGIVVGLPMTHAGLNASNPFAVLIKGPNDEVAYILAFQPKSFDWRKREAFPHKWGGGHHAVRDAALAKLAAICGIAAP